MSSSKTGTYTQLPSEEKAQSGVTDEPNLLPKRLSSGSIDSPAPSSSARKLFVNITVEYISNVDTKSETFDTRYFFRFEWEPTKQEKQKYESKESNRNLDDDEEKEGEEDRIKRIFKCPEFRYPNAKEFDIIKDDGIEYKKGMLKGGFLITSTILEQLELRNFPLDVQHFSIIIECVNPLEEFEFYPRVTEKEPKRSSVSAYPVAVDSQIKMKKQVPNKFVRLRSENVILCDFQLRNILAEITESKEGNAAQRNRQHTILFVSVVMERVAEAYIWRLGLFLLILGLCSLSTWSVDGLADRLNMLFTLLLTMMALQMVVNSTIPNIPYLTILDKYTIFSFFFIFILILESSLMGVASWYDGAVDYVFFVVICLLYFLSHVYFFYYCRQKSYNEEKIKSRQCRHDRDKYYEHDEHLRTNEEYCIDATSLPEDCIVDGKAVGRKYYDTTQTQ